MLTIIEHWREMDGNERFFYILILLLSLTFPTIVIITFLLTGTK